MEGPCGEMPEQWAECAGVVSGTGDRVQNILLLYWEKEILSEAGRQMGALGNGSGGGFVEMPALSERDWCTEDTPALAARLRVKGGELEVYAGVDEAVLAALVRLLKDAE